MCSLECFVPCCGMFSIVGFVYLIIMGIIVMKQPQFVQGVEHPHKSATACFAGAGIYAGTLVLCIGAYAYDKQKKAKRAATSALLKEEQQGLTAVGGSYGSGSGQLQLQTRG